VAEASDLAGAQALPDVGWLIIERGMCDRAPADIAALLPRHRGRVVMIDPDLDPSALVGIAASTGGPEALQRLFKALDRPVCPVVVALHVPKEHTDGIARHLTAVSGHAVIVGEAGPLPRQGIVVLQGGADHAVEATADGLSLRPVRGGASNFHPNADILFTSIANLGCPVVGVILTGMGNDGCGGARALAAQGHPLLAQRPSSCAVAGMPSAAISAGVVSETLDPEVIGERLNDWFALPAM
jgi:two-component system chemotaxis response regulator CheB